MLGCCGRGSAVYRALNSNIIRESPCVWFAFGADAVGGALQAALSALSAHICICGGMRGRGGNQNAIQREYTREHIINLTYAAPETARTPADYPFQTLSLNAKSRQIPLSC